MNFNLFQQVFGISFWQALLMAVYAGALLGAYWWAYGIDPGALLTKKNPRV
jgi:hypothetical protein